MFSSVLVLFGFWVLMTLSSPTVAFSWEDGNGDHGKGSDVDIHANAGFSSGEDKICADKYVTAS